jgi:hypothetical protein
MNVEVSKLSTKCREVKPKFSFVHDKIRILSAVLEHDLVASEIDTWIEEP